MWGCGGEVDGVEVGEVIGARASACTADGRLAPLCALGSIIRELYCIQALRDDDFRYKLRRRRGKRRDTGSGMWDGTNLGVLRSTRKEVSGAAII